MIALSKTGIDLLIHFECYGDVDRCLNAYPDSGGVYTIGIGTIRYPDGKKVQKGDSITHNQAIAYFNYYNLKLLANMNRYLTWDLNQHQRDALISLFYNIGFFQANLIDTINRDPKDFDAVSKAIYQYHHDNGKDVDGLMRRRKSEIHLYTTGQLKFDFKN